MLKETKPFIVSLMILALGYAGVVHAAPYFRQEAGIVPLADSTYYIGTTTPSNLRYNGVFNNLTVSGTCTGCGTGSPFAWTAQSWGVSTSTTIGLLNGFLSTASSTFTSLVNFPSGIWNASGNVGIGTTSPQNLLHVNGSSDGLGYIRITDSVTGSMSTDGLRIGYNSGALRFQNYENSNISFFTNNTTEAVTIKNDGRVGIGTTTPDHTLTVRGTTRWASTGTTNPIDYRWIITGPTSDYDTLYLSGEASTDANSFGANGDGNSIISFKAKGENEVGIGYDAGATAHTAKLSVNGNVGIGTTTPLYKLSVEGTSSLGNQAIAGFFTATTTTDSVFPRFTFTNATGTAATTTNFHLSGKSFTLGSNYDHITGTTTKSFNMSSTTMGVAGLGTGFKNGTTTLWLMTWPENVVVRGTYCVASSTGTALLRFGDQGGNYTNTITPSTGATRTYQALTSNNTWTAGEDLTIQASSTAGQVERIGCTLIVNTTSP